MIVLLSPAKTLDYESPLPALSPTRPRFGAEAETLAAAAGRLGPKKLGELMKISPKLATLNIERFRGFADAPERPAMFAFAGDVYRGLEAYSLPDDALPYAQDHLRLLSGLYGLLRPLDVIRPYRLEMGTRWAPRRKALTDWWGDRIAAALLDDLAADGSALVLNLASHEYFAAVDGRLPASVRVIAADFREGPEEKFVSFHAKKARGTMARWVMEHRVDDGAGLRGFDSDGYRFAGEDGDTIRFVRA